MTGIDFHHVIHDIQIASTKAPGGPIADVYLDGGWPAVIERKVMPWISAMQQCAGIMVWLPGTFEPRPGAPIRYSTYPSGDFRANVDPRLLRLIDTYRADFVYPLRATLGIKQVITYMGCAPEDDVLFDADLRGQGLDELRRQTAPYMGTTIIVDQWAEATRQDARVLNQIAQISQAGRVGVEGTPRKAGPVAQSRLIKLWLRSKMLVGEAYYTAEEAATLPGIKIEMLRGWDGDKRGRAEYLTNLVTDGKPTPVHVCVGVDALL